MRCMEESPEVIEKLKLLFIDDIDSVRTLENIVTFRDLVEVLDDRDILETLLGRPYDVDSLTIADIEDALDDPSEKNRDISSLNEVTVPEIPRILLDNWRYLAKVFSIDADACLGRDDGESMRNLFSLFKIQCGNVCEKEVQFRLLRALQKCSRQDLEAAFVELLKEKFFF